MAFPEVHLWDLKSHELLAFTALPDGQVTSVGISPNWKYALLGNARGEVQVVELATGTRVGEAIKAAHRRGDGGGVRAGLEDGLYRRAAGRAALPP